MSKKIGSYEIIEPLEGGGDVHLAQAGDARVIVRVLAGTADDEAVARAGKEAAVCGALDHDAIAPVHEISAEPGRLVVASAAPPAGARLSTAIGRLTPEAVWVIGYDVAGALAQAHAAADDEGEFFHVCHGHLSPEVIHLGAGGEVRLEGLGLAPLVGEAIVPPDVYTAPEQRGGGRVTPRGDIYALATVLYALLTGKAPSLAPSARDIAAKVPPSFREAFALALEGKVSSRRITALELEQWLSDLVTDAGREAVAAAVAGGDSPTAKAPRGERAGVAKTKSPPLRSRQATLLGRPGVPPPRKKMPSGAPLNWDDLEEAAKRPSVPPGLGDIDASWDEGWDEEKTTIAARPTEAEIERAMARAAGGTDDEATAIAERPENPGVTADDEATVIAARPDVPDEAPASQSELETRERPRPAALAAKLARPPALPSRAARASDREKPSRGSDRGLPPRPAESDRGLPPRPAESGRGAPPRPAGSTPGAVGSGAVGGGAVGSSGAGAIGPGLDQDAWADDDDGLPEELAGATVGEPAPRPREARGATGPRAAAGATARSGAVARSGAATDEDDEDELLATIAVDGPPPAAPRRPLPSEEPVIAMGPDDDEAEIELALPSDDEPPARPEPAAPAEAPVAPSTPAAAALPVAAPAPADASPAAPASEPRDGGTDSPWSAEPRPARRDASEPISLLTSALIMIGTAAIVMGIGIWWARRNAAVTIPEAPPIATATATARAEAPPRRAPPPPTASPTSEPTAAPEAAPEKDPAALPPTMGYLRVRFGGNAEARVFLKGKDAGQVGELLEVPCGFTHVNVGTPAMAWLAKDPQSVKVECQKLTEIELTPK